MSHGQLSMQPHEVREVAKQIERITHDLRSAQARYAEHAAPAATGKDEVSVAVAHTTSRMGTAQRELSETAIADLTELGKALASHADQVQRQDLDHLISVRQDI